MVDDKFAGKQMARLRGMPGEPRDPDTLKPALQERVKALTARARSEVHATRVVDSLVESCQFWPTVAEIVTACEYISGDSLPPGCPACSSDPWIHTEREVRGQLVNVSSRCDCERGRYFAARDKERRGGNDKSLGMRKAKVLV